MFSLATRKPNTRELVRAEHRLLAAPSGRPWLWTTFAMLCLVVALLLLRSEENAAHQRRIAAMAAENQALQAALEQGRLQRQEAQATEQQLLRRIAQLSAQIERLQTDLAFFRQQKKAR
ncbi:hypothetical protein [Pseudomonas lopnurensis]|uniref:hypothetical protein n=1 Tax=Pseudomonas lopnurensis TaxID=1477517 RepID=UPI0028B1D241|nr:hypothetical protein [Pseudomonas lopnurensis]